MCCRMRRMYFFFLRRPILLKSKIWDSFVISHSHKDRMYVIISIGRSENVGMGETMDVISISIILFINNISQICCIILKFDLNVKNQQKK